MSDAAHTVMIPDLALWYLLALALRGAAAAYENLRARCPVWQFVGGIAATGVLMAFVLGYYTPAVRLALGRGAPMLLIGVLLWEGWSARQDLRRDRDDPHLGPRANRMIRWARTGMTLLLVSPAVLAGVWLSVRAW